MTCPHQVKSALINNLIFCQDYIKTLYNVTFERNSILSWFKLLCEHLTKTIKLIHEYYNEDKKKLRSCQSALLLSLTQVLTVLSLLINIFVKEEEIKQVLTEARKCFIKQIIYCLESIENVINSGNSIEDPSGNFVKWMDAALEKISEINAHEDKSKNDEIFEKTQELFEEVLAHAMSIAQISCVEDSKIIRGSSQAVLNVLNSLKKELNHSTINVPMVNLFVDVCSNKLCMLERKVNTAVLRLCLKTFSQFTLPLEKIYTFCCNPANKRKMNELDNLVVDFDLHVDRIMQIGLFAVSCSSEFTRGIKIRSCLASLEALESELVPALTSMLLDNSVHNTNCAKLLMKHWLNQAESLQQLIYLIIDPFAFCQIIYEEAVEFADNLSQRVKKKETFKQEDMSDFLNNVKVLKTFLDKARSEFTENEMNKINNKLKSFNDVLEEVEVASKVILQDETLSLENCLRVVKRCKILTTVLKKLWYCFMDEPSTSSINKINSLDDRIKELPSKFENVQVQPTGNVFIDHIINRGRQLLEDRSILYRTPTKNSSTTSVKMKGQRKEIPLSKLVHLRRLSFLTDKNKSETTLDLQITELLDEMTNLSRTLTKLTN